MRYELLQVNQLEGQYMNYLKGVLVKIYDDFDNLLYKTFVKRAGSKPIPKNKNEKHLVIVTDIAQRRFDARIKLFDDIDRFEELSLKQLGKKPNCLSLPLFHDDKLIRYKNYKFAVTKNVKNVCSCEYEINVYDKDFENVSVFKIDTEDYVNYNGSIILILDEIITELDKGEL